MAQINRQNSTSLALPLTRVRITNFKAIKDVSFDLKPLNLILGGNSAGKSSILQALVLCSQNFNRGTTYSFDLNNQYLTLGPFGDLMRRGTRQGDNLTVELQFSKDLSEGGEHKYLARLTLDSRKRNLKKSSVPISRFQVSEELPEGKTELTVKLANGDPLGQASIAGTYFSRPLFLQRTSGPSPLPSGRNVTKQKLNGVFTTVAEDRFLPSPFTERSIFLIEEVRIGLIERFILDKYSQESRYSKTSLNFQEAREKRPQIIKSLRSRSPILTESHSKLTLWFEHLKNSGNFTADRLGESLKSDFEEFNRLELFKGLETIEPVEFVKFLRDMSADEPLLKVKLPQILFLGGADQRETYESAVRFSKRQFFSISDKIQYLGPLRAHALTEQKNEAPPHSWAPIGARGELLAYQLGAGTYSKAANYVVPTRKGKTVKFTVESLTLHKALSLWAQWFDLGDNILTIDEGVWGSYLELDGEKFHRKGTGISQVLPVIAICLMAPRQSLTLIEQPELHLHPAMQQKLGTFFSEISKTGKRLIIETHSEYILTRIRKEIATGALENDNVSLTFVSAKMGKDGQRHSEYQQVQISDTGVIAKWPEAFYDFTADDKMAIFEATMDS